MATAARQQKQQQQQQQLHKQHVRLFVRASSTLAVLATFVDNEIWAKASHTHTHAYTHNETHNQTHSCMQAERVWGNGSGSGWPPSSLSVHESVQRPRQSLTHSHAHSCTYSLLTHTHTHTLSHSQSVCLSVRQSTPRASGTHGVRWVQCALRLTNCIRKADRHILLAFTEIKKGK